LYVNFLHLSIEFSNSMSTIKMLNSDFTVAACKKTYAVTETIANNNVPQDLTPEFPQNNLV